MKKTMKKTIALISMVLLIIPLISVQGFALFDKITDVKITECEQFSYRMIEEYLKDIEEDGGAESEEDYEYWLFCEAEVTISTGEVIKIKTPGYGTSENKKRNVEVYAYVDARECEKAYENGENKVPLYIDVTLTSSIDIELDKKEIKQEISFPDCFVKSLTPVSGIAESYQMGTIIGIVWEGGKDKDENLIENAVFDIELPDGSIKRETVKEVTDEEGYEYYELDGEEIYYWVDTEEGMIEIYYMDISISQPIEIIPYPITGVKIDNVETNEAFEVESISYTLTLNDGTTQSFVFNPEGKSFIDVLGFKGYTTAPIEGMPIEISIGKTYGDEYPPREYMLVGIVADVDVMDTAELEGPEQEGTLLGEIIFRIKKFIQKIFALLPIG